MVEMIDTSLQSARETAWQQFQALGVPTVRHEEWRYTHLGAWQKQVFSNEPAENTETALASLPLDSAIEFHIIDGHVKWRQSSGIKGLTIAPYDTLDAAVQEKFRALMPETQAAFERLNMAKAETLWCIHVAEGVCIDKPLLLHSHHTAASAGKAQHLRILVLVENRASLTMVEAYTSASDVCYFNNIVTHCELKTKGSLHHYKLQQEALTSFHFAHHTVRQADNSTYASCRLLLGARLMRDDIIAKLTGVHAEVTLNGVYLPKLNQHHDTHTAIYHDNLHGKSHEMYKGVLFDKARAVYNGKVIVAKGAQKTDSQQVNRTLLLSPHTEIDTKPELQIFADDVRCSHGATVGELDEAQLFYLQSRGIAAIDARRLLIEAFLQEVTEQIENKAVQQWFMSLIQGAMHA